MVFTFTIRDTLIASTIVTTAGSPSGTAATAREIAVISISRIFRFCSTAIANNSTQSRTDATLSTFPSSASFFWSGVNSFGTVFIIEAIFPISVCIPLAITIPSPRPPVTMVDIKASFFRSPACSSPAAKNAASFSTGRDSPVSADSSIFRFQVFVRRKSAGTCIPASRITRSPAESSAAATFRIFPSRRTYASGLVSFFSESRAF